jgi:hypothetical protein
MALKYITTKILENKEKILHFIRIFEFVFDDDDDD